MRTKKAMLFALIFSLHAWVAQGSANIEVGDLASIELEDIGGFWKDDNPEIRQDQSSANFQHDAAYLGGLRYHGKNKKVEVAVFKSEADALNAMKALRATVAMVIEPGETPAFAGSRWWFSDGNPYTIFVQSRNTIITIGCFGPHHEQSEVMLHDAARAVLERIQRRMETSGSIGDDPRSKRSEKGE